MNSITLSLLFSTSRSTPLSLSSNSPRNLAPAISAVRSSAMICHIAVAVVVIPCNEMIDTCQCDNVKTLLLAMSKRSRSLRPSVPQQGVLVLYAYMHSKHKYDNRDSSTPSSSQQRRSIACGQLTCEKQLEAAHCTYERYAYALNSLVTCLFLTDSGTSPAAIRRARPSTAVAATTHTEKSSNTVMHQAMVIYR
jgi:hypothetical protein